MPDRLRFSMPGDKDSITAVRAAIASYANSAGFSLMEVEDVSIAITEACKIICCHGLDGWACRFLVLVKAKDDVLDITISGNSSEILEKGKACKICARCPDDGELAMFILSSLMDEAMLTDDSEGTRTLVMKKRKERKEV